MKQERDELKIQLQNHKPPHSRLRLDTEARAKASKALEVAKREEADIVELSALKRAEVDQFKGTLLQHNNSVEPPELRYRTEAGAELVHFESPGVQTAAGAVGFRDCLKGGARDVFDAFCKEIEQSANSDGLGAAAKTPVIPPAPAPETPAQVGAFADLPDAQDSHGRPAPRATSGRALEAPQRVGKRTCTGAQGWPVRQTCISFVNSR